MTAAPNTEKKFLKNFWLISQVNFFPTLELKFFQPMNEKKSRMLCIQYLRDNCAFPKLNFFSARGIFMK